VFAIRRHILPPFEGEDLTELRGTKDNGFHSAEDCLRHLGDDPYVRV
jgi:hypothetical protein